MLCLNLSQEPIVYFAVKKMKCSTSDWIRPGIRKIARIYLESVAVDVTRKSLRCSSRSKVNYKCTNSPSFSSSSETVNKPRGKNPRGHFFSRVFLSRHARGIERGTTRQSCSQTAPSALSLRTASFSFSDLVALTFGEPLLWEFYGTPSFHMKIFPPRDHSNLPLFPTPLISRQSCNACPSRLAAISFPLNDWR